MGAVLTQQNHPIAFFSKPFCNKLLHSSTYVWELAASTTTIKKWHHYLQGHHFIILTDHRSLKELMSQVIQTPEQQIYLARLLGFDYSIQYRSGKTNSVADALSRVHETSPGQLLSLTVPYFTFLQDLKAELQNHPAYQELWRTIETNSSTHSAFVLTPDFILQQNRIWLPQGCSFIPLIMAEFHSTPTGGHMGISKTLARINQNFMWHGMRDDVCHFVTTCLQCQ